MKTLLLLRHAKSSWKNLMLADHDRPLNKRGKRDGPRMGQLLREEDLVPELIISSTAKRARKTAKAVAKASGYEGEIHLTHSFYHAGPEAYVEILSSLPGDHQRVMVVGHNPEMEEFLDLLTETEEFMPTAALAEVTLPIERWTDLDVETKGELVNLWRPRELA